MSVGRICNRVVATASPNESIREAARRMAKHAVGSLVVLGPDRQPNGIITDRDIAISCVAENVDADNAKVGELMTTPVQSVNESTPIEEAVSRMASGGIRRLAVTDDTNELVGIIALDDVLELLFEETGTIGRLLEQQTSAIRPV